MIAWIASRITPGGRVYLEWPGPASAIQPPREAFLAESIDIMITNFFDDATHLRLIPPTELNTLLTAAGFAVTASGTIGFGIVGEEMLARGLANADAFSRLAGYWSMTGWSAWIEAVWPAGKG